MCRSQDALFESCIVALKCYHAKYGHLQVSEKEDKSLWNFMSKVRQSVKKMQKGKTPLIKLTPDQMDMLQQIGGFDF